MGNTYDGKPCKHGHGTERYVANKACVVCAKSASARHYHANPEQSASNSRRYRANPVNVQKMRDDLKQWIKANGDRVKATSQKWRDSNRDRIKPMQDARSRKWADDNPDRVRANHRQWSERNRNHVNERSREGHRRNPERGKPHKHNRRARQAGNGGRFTQRDIDLLYLIQQGKCAYCSVDYDLHIDHVVPVACGGTSWPWNLQLLCAKHNKSKSIRSDEECRHELGVALAKPPLLAIYRAIFLI